MSSPDCRAIAQAIDEYVSEEPHRGVSLETFRGPAVSLDMAGDYSFPAASVVKLGIAATVYSQVDNGLLSLEDRISLNECGQTVYPSILAVFDADHEFSLREFCGLMLATSDNPVTQYLLDRLGLDAVNVQLECLGARATRIRTGFEDSQLGEEGRANVTTPNDAIRILSALYREARYSDIIVALKNNLRNCRIPSMLPDSVSVAHKTGSLQGVAADAGILYGRSVDLAVAFFSDRQADTARTSLAIGSCTAKLWKELGEVA